VAEELVHVILINGIFFEFWCCEKLCNRKVGNLRSALAIDFDERIAKFDDIFFIELLVFREFLVGINSDRDRQFTNPKCSACEYNPGDGFTREFQILI